MFKHNKLALSLLLVSSYAIGMNTASGGSGGSESPEPSGIPVISEPNFYLICAALTEAQLKKIGENDSEQRTPQDAKYAFDYPFVGAFFKVIGAQARLSSWGGDSVAYYIKTEETVSEVVAAFSQIKDIKPITLEAPYGDEVFWTKKGGIKNLAETLADSGDDYSNSKPSPSNPTDDN